MNFDDTLQEAAFRAKVRAWIDSNAPKHLEEPLSKLGFGQRDIEGYDDTIDLSRDWQKKKAEAGFACLQWPLEFGGGGLGPMERVIWGQEEGAYAALHFPFSVGQGMCGPTMLAWASEADKKRYLPPIVSGEEIWCQLFSEPGCGSDLAGVRTRAERATDGSGDWIINGQKIWTSYAQYSDFGLIITRTDQDVPKHKGLTAFFLDVHAPGVEMRPIKQANGDSEFNEVFFTDVRVPDSQRLGDPGQGWQVALTTLMNERLSIGSGIPTGFEELLDFCRTATVGDVPALDDPMVRSRLAYFAARSRGLAYTSMRSISALSKGEMPGPENSIGKLVAGAMMQEIATFALDLQGPAGALFGNEFDPAASFQAMVLRSPATRIEGGSDEILRNIIAERVLGLPGDIRVDKTATFRELSTGGGLAAQG
ncbi:MAG: acyl-CoA dehydrogenase [Sphingomonadales bacterium]|nr:MAG: acyl-CoA dehydrogenase [Sphingomonadales bacterium]